jgi:hypothetical protein
LCDPADRGQGFLVRQIVRLVEQKGPVIFLKRYLIRTELRQLRELLSRYYHDHGVVRSEAVQETLQQCLSFLYAPEKSSTAHQGAGSAFVFTPSGAGAIKGDVLKILNPFDPNYARRPEQEANILRSNLSFLRVDDNLREDPWVVMGSRAEELIRMEPAATFVSAPKKYVRYWPERLKTREPYFPVRGLLGWLAGGRLVGQAERSLRRRSLSAPGVDAL